MQNEEKNAEKDRRKTEAAAEKERARQAKEEKRKSSQHKPGLLSGFLHRSEKNTTAPSMAVEEGEPTSSATRSTTEDPAAGTAIEGATVHDQVTVKTDGTSTPVVATSTEPVVHTDLQEPTTTGIADTLVDPSSTRKSVDARPSTDRQVLSDDEIDTATSPRESRVKSWMKVKFTGRSEKQKEPTAAPVATTTLPAATSVSKEEDSEQVPRVDSMRDVAMAGKTSTNETQDLYGSGRDVSPVRDQTVGTTAVGAGPRRSSSISSLSSEDVAKETSKPADFSLGTTQTAESDGEQRGRTGLRDRLLNKIKSKKEPVKEQNTVQPVPSNTTDDEFEEARDQFEEEKLEPPPPLSSVTAETSGGKTMSPKGSRDRSRFTEEL